MDKHVVSRILSDIASLLELQGENVFKIRAYQNAARVIADLDQDLPTLVQTGALKTLRGIGPAINEKVTTLVTTGRLPYYEDLQKSFPASLLELTHVQGLGVRKAKVLYDSLNIQSLADLEKACKAGKLAKLPGFGKKSEDNILKGLAYLEQHVSQYRYDQAKEAADTVLEELAKVSGIQRLSVCGSLRRRKEIVRDVDLLASAKDPSPVMKKFAGLRYVKQILGNGPTKSSVLLNSGVQVDLRVVTDDQFPFALHYFTGSKEHNIVMRQRAIAKNLKLNEYGLFTKNDKPISCQDESQLFEQLGLSYIPPELREDRGEVAAAENGALPKLIEDKDICGVFHVHSTWSDGAESLEDMIAAAQARGYDYVGISDHSKTATYAGGLTEDKVLLQRKEVERLRKKFKIHIFWGTECDILKDGSMDYSDDFLSQYDFVIASVHSFFKTPETEMTQRIIRALKNKHVTFLGHMSGRKLLSREPYPLNYDEILKVAAAEHVAIEINADPHRLDIDWRYLQRAKALGNLFSINPDAHSSSGLDYVQYGVGIARKGWLTSADVINTRTLPQIKKFLR